MLCIGVDLESFRVQALAEQHDHVFASVGVHPHKESREPRSRNWWRGRPIPR